MQNILKKLMAGALAALMLICAIPLSAVAASGDRHASPEPTAGQACDIMPDSLKSDYASSDVTDALRILEKLVDIDNFRAFLFRSLKSCPRSLDISAYRIPRSSTNFSAICAFIRLCMPEAFHVRGISGWYENNVYTDLDFTYDYTATEYNRMYAEIERALYVLLDGIKDNSNLNDVEKALLLHDRLALWCTYDNDNIRYETFPTESYSAYGALVKRVSVCQGYAEAYKLLLERVGIENYLCPSESMNHVWNIVYINGTPYHVDVTHDDGSSAEGAVSHDNFLVSTNQYRKNSSSHYVYDFDSSPQSSYYDNAFWRTSKAAFQYVGGELYYIDHSDRTLCRWDDTMLVELLDLSNATWYHEGTYYWTNSFARLASTDTDLFISLNDGIYVYSPQSQSYYKLYTPTGVSKYNSIFGFSYLNGYFTVNLTNEANAFYYGNATYKQYTTRTDLYSAKEAATGLWVSHDGEKTWYFIGSDGKADTGWHDIDNHRYFFNGDGVMLTGWQLMGNNWYHFGPGGKLSTGWFNDGGKWYYFRGDGIMLTDWQLIGGKWYYFKPDGKMATGWQQADGKWYYFNPGGSMKTGWLASGNTWYYLKPGGSMATGWQKIDGKWFHFASSGKMHTGWELMGKDWYYFNPGGSMKTGWLKDGGNWYYFQPNGKMALGWVRINGSNWYFYPNGVWRGY